MKKIFTLFVFSIITSQLIQSQEKLTLQIAIETGLKNNFSIGLVKTGLEIDKNNVSLGNAGFLPKIDISADYTKSIQNVNLSTIANLGIVNPAANTFAWNAGINLKWTLFDGMKMFLNYDILNKMENIGEDRVRAEIENIVADIISQYYEIARYSKILQFLKEQVEISRYRLQVARANFESGLGSELEVNRAEVDLNFDNSDYENITASYLNAKTKLNSILSRDIKEAFITNDSIPSVTALNYEDLKQDFLNQNKELKQIRQRRDLNYVYIKDVLGNQYPSLSFHAGYNYMNTETEAALANRSKIYGLSFGLTGNYNLFNGSNDQREYENARMEAAGYDIRVLQEENDFESQLAIVFDQFETASKLIDAETRNCSLAIRNMEIAKDSYSLGSISSLDLRELQKNLLQANERLLDSRYRAKILETQLLFLSGRIIK